MQCHRTPLVKPVPHPAFVALGKIATVAFVVFDRIAIVVGGWIAIVAIGPVAIVDVVGRIGSAGETWRRSR